MVFAVYISYFFNCEGMDMITKTKAVTNKDGSPK